MYSLGFADVVNVAGSFVLTGVLLSVFVHQYFVVLSGVVGFGLMFTALIDWCGMGIFLAKMPWNKVNNATCETTTQKA